jgi:hypothetical protein
MNSGTPACPTHRFPRAIREDGRPGRNHVEADTLSSVLASQALYRMNQSSLECSAVGSAHTKLLARFFAVP